MRRRSLTQRAFTALFGLWFSLLVAEPMPLHACPMHDGAAARPTAASTTLPVDGSDGEHAGMHASGSHQRPAPDHPGDHGDHQCQCLGCCAGASALSLPDAPDVNLCGVIMTAQARRRAADDVLQVATRFAFALPFAIGPPSIVQPAG